MELTVHLDAADALIRRRCEENEIGRWVREDPSPVKLPWSGAAKWHQLDPATEDGPNWQGFDAFAEEQLAACLELSGDSWGEVAWKSWLSLLAMALRDGANSVHFHPWPTTIHGCQFSYLVGGTEYGLVPPRSELIPFLAEAWRVRLAAGRWGRVRRWLFPRQTVAGKLRTVLHGKATEWAVICWSVGTAEGVDIYRLSPLPPADE